MQSSQQQNGPSPSPPPSPPPPPPHLFLIHSIHQLIIMMKSSYPHFFYPFYTPPSSSQSSSQQQQPRSTTTTTQSSVSSPSIIVDNMNNNDSSSSSKDHRLIHQLNQLRDSLISSTTTTTTHNNSSGGGNNKNNSVPMVNVLYPFMNMITSDELNCSITACALDILIQCIQWYHPQQQQQQQQQHTTTSSTTCEIHNNSNGMIVNHMNEILNCVLNVQLELSPHSTWSLLSLSTLNHTTTTTTSAADIQQQQQQYYHHHYHHDYCAALIKIVQSLEYIVQQFHTHLNHETIVQVIQSMIQISHHSFSQQQMRVNKNNNNSSSSSSSQHHHHQFEWVKYACDHSIQSLMYHLFSSTTASASAMNNKNDDDNWLQLLYTLMKHMIELSDPNVSGVHMSIRLSALHYCLLLFQFYSTTTATAAAAATAVHDTNDEIVIKMRQLIKNEYSRCLLRNANVLFNDFYHQDKYHHIQSLKYHQYAYAYRPSSTLSSSSHYQQQQQQSASYMNDHNNNSSSSSSRSNNMRTLTGHYQQQQQQQYSSHVTSASSHLNNNNNNNNTRSSPLSSSPLSSSPSSLSFNNDNDHMYSYPPPPHQQQQQQNIINNNNNNSSHYHHHYLNMNMNNNPYHTQQSSLFYLNLLLRNMTCVMTLMDHSYQNIKVEFLTVLFYRILNPKLNHLVVNTSTASPTTTSTTTSGNKTNSNSNHFQNFEMMELVLEHVIELCRNKPFLTEIYLYNDCVIDRRDVFAQLCHLLVHVLRESPSDLYHIHSLAMTAILNMIKCFSSSSSSSSSSDKSNKTDSRSSSNSRSDNMMMMNMSHNHKWRDMKKMKQMSIQFALDLNASVKNGLNALCQFYMSQIMFYQKTRKVSSSLSPTSTTTTTSMITFLNIPDEYMDLIAQHIATFLHEFSYWLDKEMIFNVLKREEPLCLKIMQFYMSMFDMRGMRVDDALRLVVWQVKLNGEGQQITRVLQEFGTAYYKQNSDLTILDNEEECWALAVAVLMLQTDLHNMRNFNRRMTMDQWLTNTSYINNGRLNEEEMKQIYHCVASCEFVSSANVPFAAFMSEPVWSELVNQDLIHHPLSTLLSSSAPSFFSTAMLLDASQVTTQSPLITITPQHNNKNNSKNSSHSSDLREIQEEKQWMSHLGLDVEMFSAMWSGTLLSTCIVLENAIDTDLLEMSIRGFLDSAKIAAHYHLTPIFDNLVTTLTKYSSIVANSASHAPHDTQSSSHYDHSSHLRKQHRASSDSSSYNDDDQSSASIPLYDTIALTDPMTLVLSLMNSGANENDDDENDMGGSSPLLQSDHPFLTAYSRSVSGDAADSTVHNTSNNSNNHLVKSTNKRRKRRRRRSQPSYVDSGSHEAQRRRREYQMMASKFGADDKAQIACRTVFAITRNYGDNLREGWRDIVRMIRQMFNLRIIPKILLELINKEENSYARRIENEKNTSPNTRSNSYLFGFFGNSSDNEEMFEKEAIEKAKKCILQCRIDELLLSVHVLTHHSLDYLIRELVQYFLNVSIDSTINSSSASGNTMIDLILKDQDTAVDNEQQRLMRSIGSDSDLNSSSASEDDHHDEDDDDEDEDLYPSVYSDLDLFTWDLLSFVCLKNVEQGIAFEQNVRVETALSNVGKLIVKCNGRHTPDIMLHQCLKMLLKLTGIIVVRSSKCIQQQREQKEEDNLNLEQQQQQIQKQLLKYLRFCFYLVSMLLKRLAESPNAIPDDCYHLLATSLNKLYQSNDVRLIDLVNTHAPTLNQYHDMLACVFVHLLQPRQQIIGQCPSYFSLLISLTVNECYSVQPVHLSILVSCISNYGVKIMEHDVDTLSQVTVMIERVHKWCHSVPKERLQGPWLDAYILTLQSLSILSARGCKTLRNVSLNTLQRILVSLVDAYPSSSSASAQQQQQQHQQQQLLMIVIHRCLFTLLDELLSALERKLAQRQKRGGFFSSVTSSASSSDDHLLQSVSSIGSGQLVLSIQHSNANIDLASLEEVQFRACHLLAKIFLHYLPLVYHLQQFDALWGRVLSYMARYLSLGSELLLEAIPELIKNMVLVMNNHRVFRQRPHLWSYVLRELEEMIPDLLQELGQKIYDDEQQFLQEQLRLQQQQQATSQPQQEPTANEASSIETQVQELAIGDAPTVDAQQ